MKLDCPACGGTDAKNAFTIRARWHVKRCRTCHTLFVADPPSVEETADLYRSGDYFIEESFARGEGEELLGYGSNYLEDRDYIERKFTEVLVEVERRRAPGRLLDVGSGPGFLIAAAQRRGWDAEGVDLNPWASEYARDELGLKVTNGTLHDAGFPDASFDAVTMMDLVEHLGEPRELLAEAARILRPGGVLVVLTPDAGSPVSRALAGRWPEVKRAPEHLSLFSVDGLSRLLDRLGFDPYGWHSVGKTATLETLLADTSLAAPRLARGLHPLFSGTRLGQVTIDLDPRTKFCLYAVRRGPEVDGVTPGPPRRLAKPRASERSTEEAILDELRSLAAMEKVCDWMFEQFEPYVGRTAVEVGAGIGTFSQRLLDAGTESLLLIEPEEGCAGELERRFGGDPRVSLSRDYLPGSPDLERTAGTWDLALCQNVLEHIEDHRGAVGAMAEALRPGGVLSLLVPAHPRLFGPLDDAYGHYRRYTPELLRELVEAAGLEVIDLYRFNLLGIPGWWVKNRTGSTHIGPQALRAYEAVVGAWRAVERRRRPPAGLSLIVHARRPAG